MAKIKLDTKKIKEVVTKRYEIVALGAGATLAVLCLLMGVSTFFGASSPDQGIVKTASDVERQRLTGAPSDEGPKERPQPLTAWPEIKPDQARLVLTRPFFSPGDAGDNRRFMPKILTMDRDPNSFQLDYLHRGVFVYDARDTDKKLKVFPVAEGQQGTVDPVFLVIDKRMVVVSGLFPYYAQSEEYKKALRFDDLKAMFAEGLAPTFEGLVVERRKITKGEDGKDKIGEWEVVYGVDPQTGKTQPSPAVVQLLQTCLYDSAQVDKYTEVIFGASVTPLPLIAGKSEYPDIKIPAVAKAMVAAPAAPPIGVPSAPGPGVMTKGKGLFPGGGDLSVPGGGAKGMQGMQGSGSPVAAGRPRLMFQPTSSAQARNPQSLDYDALPKDLQDQLKGNLNWTSPYGTFVDEPGKGDEAKDGGEGKKDGVAPQPGPGLGKKGGITMPGPANPGEGGFFDPQSQGANLKAPTYPPSNPMALVRFVDVDVAAGADYQYRIAVRLANPNYQLSTKLVANAGWTKNKELASDWVETPRISIPEEYHYYVINQTKGWVSRIVSQADPNRNTTNDSMTPANAYRAERIPFQIHKYVGNFRDSRDEQTRYVADWEIAERVLVGKGEALGREVDVEAIAWNWGKGQFEYASTGTKSSKGAKFQGLTGLPVDFRPPQPIILLDYVGGQAKYTSKFGGAPILDSPCATEALLLMPDGTMIVRNSRHDMDDRGYDNPMVDLGGHWLGIERRQRVEEWRTRHEDFRKDAAKTLMPPPDMNKKGSGIN